MELAALITLSLRAISTLTSDPRLGGGGMKRERTAEMLNLLAVLIEAGDEVRDELEAFAMEVAAMARDGVQPSERHLQALRDRSAAATARLEGAAERLGLPPAASTEPLSPPESGERAGSEEQPLSGPLSEPVSGASEQ